MHSVTVMTIVLGSIWALAGMVANLASGCLPIVEVLDYARLDVSSALGLGLTFFVGAEIIKTFRVPNWHQLAKVGALIIIRQLMSWALDAETARLERNMQQRRELRFPSKNHAP